MDQNDRIADDKIDDDQRYVDDDKKDSYRAAALVAAVMDRVACMMVLVLQVDYP